MKNKILFVLATMFALIMNGLSTLLPLNGISTKMISDNLNTLITPAGFTFGIWSLIYIWLVSISIMYAMGRIKLPREAVWIYIGTCICNGLWIVTRHYSNLHLSMLLILWLLIGLIVLDRDIRQSNSWWVRNIFLWYLGRVQIATLLMTIIYMQYQLEWFAGNYVYICSGVIAMAGLLNLLVIYKEKNIVTSLVAMRAMRGIINAQTNLIIIYTARSVFAILWIWSIMSIYNSNKNKLQIFGDKV